MKREIKFNSFYSSSNYTKNLEKLFADYELFRQKHFSNLCIKLLKKDYPDSEILLTHSATGALEMIALALDIKEGDEIILPSYTFVSTANAFALRGAKLVFVDIEMDTFGIDPELVESVITDKTRAIIGVHYAGNSCKIEELAALAEKNKLILIEDAAMAFGSKQHNKALGTFGDFAVVSFDVTKHISATQGGCLLINNPKYVDSAYEVYHIGTNRSSFENKEVPYYEWVSLGSKYQMPETNAAILLEQLQKKNIILKVLSKLSKQYFGNLKAFNNSLKLNVHKSLDTESNYHEFFILLSDEQQRDVLASYLSENGIEALFHYVPLHNSTYALENCQQKALSNTVTIAKRILRLPLHTKMTKEDVAFICSTIEKYMEL